MIKKGVMSPFMIGFLLALTGFIILSAALIPKFFNQGDITDRESCHLSVLARGSVPFGTRVLPLKCYTEKICITGEMFGKCEQFIGEKNVRRVRVNVAKEEETKRIIEQEMANAMFDCWKTMGEGKIDVFTGSGIFDIARPQCVVCSRVAVDAKDDKLIKLYDQTNLNNYISKELVPGYSLTYLQMFTDRSINSFVGDIVDKDGKSTGETKDIALETKSALTSREIAFVFSQVRTTEPMENVKDVVKGGFVFGGSTVLTSLGRAVVLNPFGATLVAGAFTAVSLDAYLSAIESQAIAAGYCGNVVGGNDKDNAKGGCSIVKPISWNAQQINLFCSGGLEGNL